MRAYVRRFDDSATPVSFCIGCSAEMVQHILQADLAVSVAYNVACCIAVVKSFIFQVCSVSMAHLHHKNILLEESGMTVTLLRRKGKLVCRTLRLRCGRASNWGPSNPIAMVRKWMPSSNLTGPGFSMWQSQALQPTLVLTGIQPPQGCTYSAP